MMAMISHLRLLRTFMIAILLGCIAQVAAAEPFMMDGATTGTTETLTARDLAVFTALEKKTMRNTSGTLILALLESKNGRQKRSPLFFSKELEALETSPAMKNAFQRNALPFRLKHSFERPGLLISGESELSARIEHGPRFPRNTYVDWIWLPGYDSTGRICIIYGFMSGGGSETGLKYTLTKTAENWSIVSVGGGYTLDFY